MIACYYCELSLETIYKVGSLLTGFGSLIIGLATLILLIVGYYKFLQNKLRDKQLKTVFELITRIQQDDWHYITYNNLSGGQFLATLFDIAEMNEFDEDIPLYFWGQSMEQQNEGDLFAWDFFFKFYSNPYLPTSIAEPLKKFNLWQQSQTIKFKEVKDKKYIALGRKKTYNQDTAYFNYYSEGEMATCKGFKKVATELKDAINKWAAKYRLDDLNITTSHIHQMYKNKQRS